MSGRTVRVLVADDHPLYREALATAVQTRSGLEDHAAAVDAGQNVGQPIQARQVIARHVQKRD